VLAPVIHNAALLLLVAIFATAAISKALTPLEFEGVVTNYRLVPHRLVPPIARLLPAVEAATVVLLLLPATRPVGAATAAILLLAFAFAMAVNVRRGRTEIDCGCFRTTHRQRLSWWLVGRNLALVLVAVALWLPVTREPILFDWLQAALAGGALSLLYLAGSEMTLPRPPSFDENFERSLGDAHGQEV
jgi:hypothetical protein